MLPVARLLSAMLYTLMVLTIFLLEFWLNYHESGTILQQGTGASSFALALDESGHAVVNIAGTQVVSEATLPQDKWTYFVMSYKAVCI